MGPDTIWIFIPLFALSIPIIRIWSKHQRAMAEIQAKTVAERSAQYANNNTQLEDRVRVLERIVTDKGYDVASQIEALRDARKVEALIDNRDEELR
jgi:hypothetical protein